jgi:putative transposase
LLLSQQDAFPGQGRMKAEQLEIAQLKREVSHAEGGAGHPKKNRGLLREGIDVKFGFIAKHRGIWPANWMCEALGVSRGGFYAWLTRPRSARSRSDEELGAKIRTSFLASHRTYGARRVWRDLLAGRAVVRSAPDRAFDAATGPQSTPAPAPPAARSW